MDYSIHAKGFSYLVNLSRASNFFNNAKTELAEVGNSYETALVVATGIAQEWEIATDFKNKRSRKVNKHFEDLAEDERLANPDSYKIYYSPFTSYNYPL